MGFNVQHTCSCISLFLSLYTEVMCLLLSYFFFRKRRRESEEDEAQPYVKKPRNAFMVFLKEHRSNVEVELNIRNSATVNRVVAQRVSVFALYVCLLLLGSY